MSCSFAGDPPPLLKQPMHPPETSWVLFSFLSAVHYPSASTAEIWMSFCLLMGDCGIQKPGESPAGCHSPRFEATGTVLGGSRYNCLLPNGLLQPNLRTAKKLETTGVLQESDQDVELAVDNGS